MIRKIQAFVLGIVLTVILATATAAEWTPTPYNPSNPWVQSQMGGQSRNLNPGSTPDMRTVSMHGPGGYTVIETPNGSSVPITRTIPVRVPVKPLPVDVPVKDTIKLPKAAIARAGAKFAVRAAPLIGLGLTAYDLYEYLEDDGITYDEEGNELVKEVGGSPATQKVKVLNANANWPTGVNESSKPVANSTFNSAAELKARHEAWVPPGATCLTSPSRTWITGPITHGLNNTAIVRSECCGGTYTGTCNTFAQTTFEKTTWVCPDGTPSSQGATCGGDKRRATEDEIYDAFVLKGMAEMAEILGDLKQAEEPIELSHETPSDLQATVPSASGQELTTTTTRVKENGSTETLTRTDQQVGTLTTTGTNVSNQTITYNITNNYTVTNQSGQVVEQSQQDKPQLPEEDYSFNDPAFPPIPELYEQKYPNGLVGVWDAKKGQIMDTPLINGIQGMFPDLGGSGSCPSWGLGFNLGTHMSYGTHNFGVPCSIWQVIGLIILTSACFYAWRLIVGG